jgi:signal transduction histidine kinase
MQWSVPGAAQSELAAAFFQTAITVALAALCAFLHRSYRKAAFLFWAIAWLLYSLRMGAIISFLMTGSPRWLFWHQVMTGWTALALLWAALAFAQRVTWRNAYLGFVSFPVIWSYLAIYQLDNFLLAAGPAVLFLSGATLLTSWTFYRHARTAGSPAAAFLAGALLLWALHHLDYPFLRARGVWNPWGYYLDIAFVLATGIGILLLVQEELNRGLRTLSSLSAVLQPEGREGDVVQELLGRLLTLPAVIGGALWLSRRPAEPDAVVDAAMTGGAVVRSVGACAAWEREGLPRHASDVVNAAIESGRPEVARGANGSKSREHAYVAALPVYQGIEARGAIVVVGEARDPFAALDAEFLLALGHQVGAALANAELYRGLASRTTALERLASRMVHQNEEQRRRLSRELHDETAQLFAAVNMQLGLARESVPVEQTPRIDRALALVNEGMRSIRRVTEDLRPSLLEELRLLPALRGLADDFREQHKIGVQFDAPQSLPPLSEEAELALFRALQEALANVARHARAHSVAVSLSASNGSLRLDVRDDGRGLTAETLAQAAEAGRMGLAGMRARIGTLGGELSVTARPGSGVELAVVLPTAHEGSP